MKLKPADLILVRGTDWISEAIEDVEHSQYSHVAGCINDFELIEAEGFSKTGYRVLSAYRGHADVFRCESATDQQRRNMQHTATWSVGGRYDYLLLFIELIRYWFGVLVPYREPPVREFAQGFGRGSIEKRGSIFVQGLSIQVQQMWHSQSFCVKSGVCKGGTPMSISARNPPHPIIVQLK